MRAYSLIVMLTNVCNQNCEFCFAKQEMSGADKKEIDMQDFKMVVGKMVENNLLGLYLYGGEPTLHSRFKEIVEYSLRHFFAVSLSTNGIFSEDTLRFFVEKNRRVNLMFNICTPGFVTNPAIRKQVLRNIEVLSEHTCVTLGLNSTFLRDDLNWVVDLIPKHVLKRLEVCLGVTRPMAGGVNFIPFRDFPKTGKHIVNLIDYMDKKGPPTVIDFIAGTNPCMFSDAEREKIKARGAKLRYGCHLGYHYDWFMVTPNLTAVRCYPLSSCDRFSIDKGTDFRKLKDKFVSIHRQYRAKYVIPECRSCKFYGTGEGKCTGPCLAVRMNELRAREDHKKSDR